MSTLFLTPWTFICGNWSVPLLNCEINRDNWLRGVILFSQATMCPSSTTWTHYQPTKTRLSTRQGCSRGTASPQCSKSTSSSRKRAKRARRGPWSTTETMSPCMWERVWRHFIDIVHILSGLNSTSKRCFLVSSGIWRPRKTEWRWCSARCSKTTTTSSSAKSSCRWVKSHVQ